MKVFAHNTGILLYDRCSAISEEHSKWRCIYMNFTTTGPYTRSLRSFIIDTVITALADEEGAIYLCNDGDILILFEGGLKPVARQLGSHFEDFNLALSHPSDDNPFNILDLSRPNDWMTFAHLCSAKYLLLSETAMISAAVAGGAR